MAFEQRQISAIVIDMRIAKMEDADRPRQLDPDGNQLARLFMPNLLCILLFAACKQFLNRE
ncbi:hypothetical protein BZY94_06250 [Burkholderia territorii]|nr:hypothetical protein BZY94_06250 [Burkholderia territorii]